FLISRAAVATISSPRLYVGDLVSSCWVLVSEIVVTTVLKPEQASRLSLVENTFHRLIADFRGSLIVARGSRPPSLATIHFFSLRMMSSSRVLSSGVGMYSFKCCS